MITKNELIKAAEVLEKHCLKQSGNEGCDECYLNSFCVSIGDYGDKLSTAVRRLKDLIKWSVNNGESLI